MNALTTIKQTLILSIIIALVSVFLYIRYDNAVTENERANDLARQRLSALKDKIEQKEKDLKQELTDLNNQHKKELQHEKQQRDRFMANVRNGTIRLSIPVSTCRGTADSTNSSIASGDRYQTRAELTPEAGATLTAIADDGDQAIRQLNACIDAYNLIRERYNVQTR